MRSFERRSNSFSFILEYNNSLKINLFISESIAGSVNLFFISKFSGVKMKKNIPAFDFTKRLNDNLGFSLSDLEDSYSGYNSKNPHRHKYYEVILFRDKGGIHEIDFNTYTIESSSIHFISPDQVHLLRREKHVKGYVISFSEEFLLESIPDPQFIDQLSYFSDSHLRPFFQIHGAEEYKQCVLFILKMKEELASDGHEKRVALNSWLRLFLIYCKRLHSIDLGTGVKNNLRSDITRRFKKLVDKEFRDIKSVKEYANRLGISAGHLSETVLKDTGKTAGEYLHDRIVLEARRLLFHSQMNIKEIAAELNFEDASYFSKFFKTRTGNSPEQFRKDIREKYL
jgi:AraC-like DNA-binding protein